MEKKAYPDVLKQAFKTKGCSKQQAAKQFLLIKDKNIDRPHPKYIENILRQSGDIK